ncbi:MAG: hypothetical protein K0R00_61 [Herbinix sp.]|jgi:hypothetical protein|nr:hypothetical protein [Herbinix sp.]
MRTKMRLVILAMVMVLTGLQSTTAFAETVIYGERVEETMYDIGLCVRLSETDITLKYLNRSGRELDHMLEKMFEPTGISNMNIGVSEEIDYYTLKLWQMSWDVETYDYYDGYYTVNLYLEYRETADETAFVIQKVKEFVRANKKKVAGLSDAEKYRWIYDHLINNMDYDYTEENDSCYEAITYGTGTCVAYSGLYYLIAVNMGLPCKIVYGKAGGGDHAWNLARLDGKWYYVDATWGDDYSEEYFMRAKKNVTTHKINEEAASNSIDENGVIVFAREDYR